MGVFVLVAAACLPVPALAGTQSVATYAFTPSPIAASGALAPGESVNVTLTAEDAQGAPVPGVVVFLWLIPAVGGGGSATVGATALTGSPQPFIASASGTVHLTYSAPDPIPAASVHCQRSDTTTRCNPTDEIMAADSATSPAVGGSDTYTFPYAQSPAVSSDGGTLVAADGTFSADVPAGDVPSGYALQVTGVSLTTSQPRTWGLPATNLQVLAAFDLTTLPAGGTVSQALPATVAYRASALAGPPEPPCTAQPCTWSPNRLALYEDEGGSWAYLPTTVNTAADTVQASVQAPGRIALVLDTTLLSDVQPGFWAQAAIDRLLAAGVVAGYPDGTFQPDAPVTRAQLTKMLIVALNVAPPDTVTAQRGFTDVPASAWYAPYVSLAASAGIVQGLTATTFGPNEPVTREQMAVMVARALQLSGTANLTFSDASAIDPWAVPGVAADVAAGLIGGLPNGSFQPLATATRAQAATLIAAALTLSQQTSQG